MAQLDIKQAAYRVLARKYRPKTFHDLIGQEAMVRTLDNAYKTNRLAHAFMLTGVRGVGKTTTARIIARAINCETPKQDDIYAMSPCGTCSSCQSILEDRNVDIMEMDAATRTGVDDIREIIEGVKYAPVSAKYKIYIIDEVHMLSKAAFNALLKTLEEPPEKVKFIFATTEIRKVPLTVLSRCQRFDLRRVTISELQTYFQKICAQEQVEIEEEALHFIARAADGSVRDGLSLLDQAIAMSTGHVSSEDVKNMLGLSDRAEMSILFQHILHARTEEALKLFLNMYAKGADPQVILQDLLDLTHNLSRLKVCGAENSTAEDMPSWAVSFYKENEETIQISTLTRIWQILIKGLKECDQAPSTQQTTEMIIIRLCYAANLPDPSKLLKAYYDQDFSDEATTALFQKADANASSDKKKNNAQKIDQVIVPEQAEAAEDSKASDYDFETLVHLFSEHGEVRLYGLLHSQIQPVKVEAGYFEFHSKTEITSAMLQKMSSCLKKWTGMNWTLIQSKKQGQPSLSERVIIRRDEQQAQAANHPIVQIFLTQLAGAAINGINPKQPC